MPRVKKPVRETNDMFVARIMAESDNGMIMQLFIMNAIERVSRDVIDYYEANPEKLNEAQFVNPHAWKACAEEVIEKLNIHFKRDIPAPAVTPEKDPRQQKLDFEAPPAVPSVHDKQENAGSLDPIEQDNAEDKQKKGRSRKD